MKKPFAETHPSLWGLWERRAFCDDDGKLTTITGEFILSDLQKHTTDNAVLRAEIDSVICDLLLFCKSEAEKAAAKAVGKGLTRVLGLDQDGDT